MSNRAISTELIELGERIRKRRQEMKLSQESFAEKAGISVNTVSRIEGGQTAMSVEIFRKMIEILETDANILMGKEGDDAEKRKAGISSGSALPDSEDGMERAENYHADHRFSDRQF